MLLTVLHIYSESIQLSFLIVMLHRIVCFTLHRIAICTPSLVKFKYIVCIDPVREGINEFSKIDCAVFVPV